MSERLLSPVGYTIVAILLILLTILTLGVSFAPIPTLMHIAAAASIAICKGSLVVLFFMHALRSTAQTRAVIAVTVFWLSMVFMLLTFSDYLTRELIPYMYGH